MHFKILFKNKDVTEGKLENTERSKKSKSAKRLDLKSHHKKEIVNYCDLVANTMMVITLQFIKVSNQHVLHLKLAQCYMSIKWGMGSKCYLETNH